jgi:hypothetical protein
VFVVALTALHGALEDEAAALALDLGCSTYDARLLLAAGTPSVLRRMAERDQALALLAKVRARGHDAVACDLASVVASDAMVLMRRFHLMEEEISLGEDSEQRLPYADVLALVPAVHRKRTDTAVVSRERKISITRAILTSGATMTSTVKKESHTATEERESVLYIFRRSGETPWLLREQGTAWGGHGQPLATSQSDNFRITVGALRSLAPAAAFDDRLVTRRAPERAALHASPGVTSIKTSSDAGVDLLAHLLGLALSRSDAYR